MRLILQLTMDATFPNELSTLQELVSTLQGALSAAGADVTYRELDDLSHCYPREMNPAILNWLSREG